MLKPNKSIVSAWMHLGVLNRSLLLKFESLKSGVKLAAVETLIISGYRYDKVSSIITKYVDEFIQLIIKKS